MCEGTEFERRELRMTVRSDLGKFRSRMEKKMMWKKLQEKKGGREELEEEKCATDT